MKARWSKVGVGSATVAVAAMVAVVVKLLVAPEATHSRSAGERLQSEHHRAGPSATQQRYDDLVAALIVAERRRDKTEVEALTSRLLEAGILPEQVSNDSRTAILQAILECQVLTSLGSLCQVAVRAGVSEEDLLDRALALLESEVGARFGLRLLSTLPIEDRRIEDAIARVLVNSVRATEQHPSRLTEVAELAMLRRGIANAATIEALRADLRRGVRRVPLLVLQRCGTTAAAAAPDMKTIAFDVTVDETLREEAVTTLAAILRPEDAQPTVATLLGDPAPSVRAAAARALACGGPPQAPVIELLQASLVDSDERVQAAAFRALAGWSGDVRGIEAGLATRLSEQWEQVRRTDEVDAVLLFQDYCEVLGSCPLRSAPVVTVVRTAAVEATDEGVRWKAAYAYWRSTGDTELASIVAVSTLGEMIIARKPVIPILAEMAFGADRERPRSGSEAVVVGRALARHPPAVEAIESFMAHPTVGRDAQLLLALVRK